MKTLLEILICILLFVSFSAPVFACPDGYEKCGESGQLCCPIGSD